MAHVYETDVRCNLCGSTEHRVLPPHSVPEKAAMRDEWGCRFVECTNCGLRFYSPRLEERYAIETFLENNRAEEEAISMATRGVFFGDPPNGNTPEQQLAELRRYYTGIFDGIADAVVKHTGNAPKSLFEAGASVGHFTEAARDRGIERFGEFVVAGCDANPFSAAQAQKRGIDIQGTTFSRYEVRPDQHEFFDIITGYDFLEHTYTPRDDLEKLRTMTRPGGVLAVKTFVDDHDPEGTMVQPGFHHYHFTLATLRDVIERAGWRVFHFDDETERVYAQVSVFATNG